MLWMYAGYMTSFYVVLVLDVVRSIHSYPNPFDCLISHLLAIPAAIIAFSMESVFLAPERWKTKIGWAFAQRSLTRSGAFCSGLLTGFGVLICLTGDYIFCEFAASGRVDFLKLHSDSGDVFWVCIIVAFLLVSFAPLIPAALLARRVQKDQHT
jgi:hypothetical protein